MNINRLLVRFVSICASLILLSSCGSSEDENSVSIQFVSATPTSITLKGTGGAGLSETSEVTFRVKDPEGAILAEQPVNFELTTTVGGITLNPRTVISDEGGLVTTIIQSGSVPTPVRVEASIPGQPEESQEGADSRRAQGFYGRNKHARGQHHQARGRSNTRLPFPGTRAYRAGAAVRFLARLVLHDQRSP